MVMCVTLAEEAGAAESCESDAALGQKPLMMLILNVMLV